MLRDGNKKDTTPLILLDCPLSSILVLPADDVDLSTNISTDAVQSLTKMWVIIEDVLLKEDIEIYQILRNKSRHRSLTNGKCFIQIDEREKRSQY